MRERHRAGRQKYMKTRAVTELRVISKIANIVAESGGATALPIRRTQTRGDR